jgi:tetratricopeptide (TPR) repeat protein
LIESQRALDLNPLDPLLNMHLGWHYMMTRQYDQAIAQLRSVLETNASHYQTLRHIGWAYMYAGLHAEAITALETATKVMPGSAQAETALAAAYATAGRSSDARALLTQLEASSPSRYVSACDLAAVYAALHESEAALDWLEKAVEEQSPRIVELALDPVFDPLRGDPRFADLLRRVGLPPPVRP